MVKQTLTIPSRIDDIEIDIGIPENWDEQKLMILHHGFNSGKRGGTYTTIGDKLYESGIAYAKFSLPYHAERRHDDYDFTLANCIEDCELVEKAIREKFPQTQIGIIGRSFGGYLSLLRFKKFHHPYFTIILLSPAIRMAEIFQNALAGEHFEEFKEQGYGVFQNAPDNMIIHYALYQELENNKVSNLGTFEETIHIYHGNLDNTAPFADSEEFAKNNPHTTLTTLENEKHAYTPEGLTHLCEEMIRLIKNS